MVDKPVWQPEQLNVPGMMDIAFPGGSMHLRIPVQPVDVGRLDEPYHFWWQRALGERRCARELGCNGGCAQCGYCTPEAHGGGCICYGGGKVWWSPPPFAPGQSVNVATDRPASSPDMLCAIAEDNGEGIGNGAQANCVHYDATAESLDAQGEERVAVSDDVPVEANGLGRAAAIGAALDAACEGGVNFEARLLEWADMYAPAIATADRLVQLFALEHGYAFREVDKVDNPHGCTAFLRETGIMCCVKDCLKPFFAEHLRTPDLHNTGVLTVNNDFGADWCQRMDPSRMSGRMHRTDVRIDWHNVELWPVPGEAGARYPGGREKPVKRDISILWDVYHGGPGRGVASGPATLLRAALDATHTGLLYVGTRKFCGQDAGLCGADVYSVNDEDGTKETWVEGFYVRHDGLIRQYSDPKVGSAYADHPDNDWMFRATYGWGVEWYFLGTHGPYHIFRVGYSDTTDVGPTISPGEDRFAIVDVAGEQCMVDRFVALELCRNSTTARGWVRDVVEKQVIAGLRKHPGLEAIKAKETTFYAKLIADTVHYCMFHGKVAEAARYHGTRVRLADAERQLRIARVVEDDIDITNTERAWRSAREMFGGITTGVVQKHYKDLLVHGSAGLVAMAAAPMEQKIAAASTVGLVVTSARAVAVRHWCPGFRFGATVTSWVMGAVAGVGAMSIVPVLFLVALVLALVVWYLRNRVHGVALAMRGLLPGAAARSLSAQLSARMRDGRRLEEVAATTYAYPCGDFLPAAEMRDVRFLDPAEERGRITITFGTMSFNNVRDCGFLDTDSHSKRVMYPLVYSEGNLVLPAVSPASLLHSINHRFMKCPAHTPSPGAFDPAVWVLGKLFHGHAACVRSIQECAVLMGGPRGRRLLAQADEVDMGNTRWTCEMMFKGNETIALNPETGTFKGRMICPVGKANAVLLPEGRGMDELMHSLFDGTPFEMDDCRGVSHTVAFHYCSGYSAERISQMANDLASATGWFVAMCGDDTVGTDGVEFFESDYSMFDSTQTDVCMKAGVEILRECMTREWLAVFKSVFTCALKTQSRVRDKILDVLLELDEAMQRSGLASTSWWNFFVNAMAMIIVIYWAPQYASLVEAVEQGTAACGFTVKCKIVEMDRLTFLKGSFHDTPNGWQWCNLPSAVLKLGKVLADPKVIVRARVHKGDHLVACRVVCHAMWLGYQRVPEDFPILGALLRCYRRIGLSVQDAFEAGKIGEITIEDFDYKPKTSGPNVAIPRENALQFVCERYDTTVEQVCELESLYDRVMRPSTIVSHPLLLRLGAVDYGA